MTDILHDRDDRTAAGPAPRALGVRVERSGYSLLQIVLHWSIAALIAIQFLFHDAMEHAFDDLVDGAAVSGDQLTGAWLHAGVGATILMLAIVRLFVRWREGAPAVHRDKPVFLVWLAYVTHVALYTFIFAMPIAGAIAWFGLIESVGDIHSFASSLLLPLIGLHVVGALAEHFVFRNDTLKRMLMPRERG